MNNIDQFLAIEGNWKPLLHRELAPPLVGKCVSPQQLRHLGCVPASFRAEKLEAAACLGKAVHLERDPLVSKAGFQNTQGRNLGLRGVRHLLCCVMQKRFRKKEGCLPPKIQPDMPPLGHCLHPRPKSLPHV